MFSKFNQKFNTIFLDSNSESFQTKEKVNVIVSPSLYWVKKVSLPVKYVREVRPLLESLFEDILPVGNYSYFTYKKDDYFFIFAYEDKVILDTLKDKGIIATQINNVFFAQSEFQNFSSPVKIDKEQSIYIKDDLVILLPSIWMEAQEVLDMSGVHLSKHSVNLNQFRHIVNNKSLYFLISIFVVLITLVSTEYLVVNSKTAQTLELRDELFTKHSLKSTMMQNRSVLKNYSKLHERQMKFREYSSYILSIPLVPTQKISQLRLKGNTLYVSFSGVPKGSEKNIMRILNKHKIQFTSKFLSDVWTVEMSL